MEFAQETALITGLMTPTRGHATCRGFSFRDPDIGCGRSGARLLPRRGEDQKRGCALMKPSLRTFGRLPFPSPTHRAWSFLRVQRPLSGFKAIFALELCL